MDSMNYFIPINLITQRKQKNFLKNITYPTIRKEKLNISLSIKENQSFKNSPQKTTTTTKPSKSC